MAMQTLKSKVDQLGHEAHQSMALPNQEKEPCLTMMAVNTSHMLSKIKLSLWKLYFLFHYKQQVEKF